MLDGQILFDGCTATGDGVTEWRIDETLTRLIASNAIPPLIVVGIDHMGVSRHYEFLPYRNPFFNPDSPEPDGRRFPDFLATDVIPLVNSRCRIAKGPQAIGGSSYGGIAAPTDQRILDVYDQYDALELGSARAYLNSELRQIPNKKSLQVREIMFRGLRATETRYRVDATDS
jgi:predicted alpha/beta superfamily hydrolase